MMEALVLMPSHAYASTAVAVEHIPIMLMGPILSAKKFGRIRPGTLAAFMIEIKYSEKPGVTVSGETDRAYDGT